MKRRVFSGFLLVVLLVLMVPSALAAAEDITGVYQGYYFATQGQTGLTLTVEGDQTKFEFYNLPGRSNAKEGSFWMDVSEEDGVYTFTAGEWIDKPDGYSVLDLVGTRSGKVLSGTVQAHTGTYEFYLELPTDAYQAVQDSLFNEHRYAVVDEGMTWEEAKAYCTEQGGYLATVTTQAEADFLASLIKNKGGDGWWLGGQLGEQDWVWNNGEAFDFAAWPGAAPQSADRLAVAADGTWKAVAAGDKLPGFVCEWGTWSDASNWSTPELSRANALGLIPDVLIGTDMTGNITRGEFSAVAVNLYEAMTGGRAIIAADCPLTDIEDTASRLYILKAYNLGIANGVGNQQFKPDDSLTREQMSTMLCRVYKLYQWPDWTLENDAAYELEYNLHLFTDDANISDFARDSVYFMVDKGIIQGDKDNKFAPRNTTTQEEAVGYANATREQSIALALRSMETLKGAS